MAKRNEPTTAGGVPLYTYGRESYKGRTAGGSTPTSGAGSQQRSSSRSAEQKTMRVQLERLIDERAKEPPAAAQTADGLFETIDGVFSADDQGSAAFQFALVSAIVKNVLKTDGIRQRIWMIL